MQRGLEVGAVDTARAGGQRLVFVVQLHLFEGARQAHGEIDVTPLRPLVHAAPAGERAFVDHAQLRIADPGRNFRLVLHAVAQIEQHMRRLALGEVIAVQASPRGGGQFGMHAAVLEAHAVVTGRCGFVGMVVARAVAGIRVIERARYQFDLAGGGHQQEIQHVADAGTGQMRMREAHDRAVGLVISRARIPHRVVGIRLSCTMPNGNVAPGKVWPWPPVPMKTSTCLVRSARVRASAGSA